MLDKLHCRFLKDVTALSKRDEERTSGLTLLRSRVTDPVGNDINEGDRGFRTIQLRIAGGYEHGLALLHQKIERLLAPKASQSSGQLAFCDCLQRPVDREKSCVAAKVSAAGDRFIWQLRFINRCS